MSGREDWTTVAMKRLLAFGNGRDHKAIEVDEPGFPVYGSGGPFAFASEFLFDGESVLFGRKGTVDKPLYVNERFWTVDTMYYTKIEPMCHARFLYYAALTIPFDMYSTNTALPSITQETLGKHKLLRPPLPEQKQIASFLDYETAKIDALIAMQQQLIALLGEKRQAVISHAVTKGLNPDAPMRDSGIEWLGEVPEHWTVKQLRRWIADMEQGKSPECENRTATNGEWAVLKTGCVNGGIYDEEENKALPDTISPSEQYEVQVGDVLMSRASGSTDLIGSVAYVDSTRPRNLLSDKIFRIRFWTGVDGKFFRYFMASSFMRDTIVRSISGAEGMANNITKTAILAFQGALPPMTEQSAIVNHIEKTTSRMEDLIEKADVALELLQERRTALISAAVTGKIDVRGWKPPSSARMPETEMEVA